MTPLHLSPDQHRSVWAQIATIKDAMRDLKDVAEHHRVFGLGDLHRRLSADEIRTSTALTQVVQILESAAEQTGEPA